MATSKVTMNLLLITLVALLAATETATKKDQPPVVQGLAWRYYNTSCPHVESIIRNRLRDLFENEKDTGLAAGLLRLHFHDCFVQGCDGSILLEGVGSEQEAEPNLSLRPEALKTIGDLHKRLVEECGSDRPVVSCADIIAIAARDSVYLSGGPYYEIPLGRKDSLNHATKEETYASISKPASPTSTLLSEFSDKGLDATDLVALSGAHTIGRAHCDSFCGRLYPEDETLNKTLATELKKICSCTATTDATIMNDIHTPNDFDNQYYVNLVNKEGLFTSDEDLYMNSATKETVIKFANDQCFFFDKFAYAMIKMGQLSVLTDTQGEVREKCSGGNTGDEGLSSVVGEEEDQEQSPFKWY